MRGSTRFGKVSRKLDEDTVPYGRVAGEMALMEDLWACMTLSFFAVVCCQCNVYVLLNVPIVHMFMFMFVKITYYLPL